MGEPSFRTLCGGAAFARSSADAVAADGPTTTAATTQATVHGLRAARAHSEVPRVCCSLRLLMIPTLRSVRASTLEGMARGDP
ncbi:hypothetical protein [Streptomyces sp. NPDC058694]|uniref:hypothetical protein n=1 Tax=Streptomyces sp. NPDC058694 TaxID=3346603 RepID=UPI0036617615